MSVSLDTIVISNFKSFSGRITIGPIWQFTAIIGLNGSGKSNITDAISFALNEKPSALRVKCLSELIYGGFTAGESMKDSTYVNVIFKLNDGTKKSFTRKIYGEISQYKIDDKIVTGVFYTTELREMGLDIKAGNFLIPQGYIEHFAMKTPKELTVMFEETSNSIMYKADYERLKLKLLEAAEEVHFQQQMKKQILIQKKYAIKEKAEMDKYLQLKEQYNKKKLKFQSIRLLIIKKEIESLQDEERKSKLQIDEYLHHKKAEILLLARLTLKFKSLSNSLENIEQGILKIEDIIQQRKVEQVIFEENISYWQKKCDCARTSLDSASKVRDTNKRIIQELEDELKQIDDKLTELRKWSQTSTIELSNSQVEHYMELMNEAERRGKDFVKQINNLMRNQQEDKLDNENRRKQELEDKVKQMRLTKENLETRFKRLQDLTTKSKTMLMEKTVKLQELNQKIIETRNKSESLENDIAKISEELSQANIDNSTISQQIKKSETIKMLKQFCSGVYGRLSDLCKPIHPRYNVAIVKVFGKNMDAIVVNTKHEATQCIQFLKKQKIGIETFLPLNSIKTIFLKEQLRTIKEPRNVKLLYDLLDISSTQVNKAVLFATKNTLVCETIEDARIIAHEPDDKRKAYDCVSLDGCFYHKDGTMSGGQADLIVKSKRWGEQQVLTLKERKAQLMQEFRNLPKISLMQSELDIINVQINGLTLQNRYIETDIRNTKNEIIRIHEELDVLDREIIVLNMGIFEIQDNIQKRDKKIKSMEKHVNAIKDEIFVDFCRDINVPDISYYEKNNLRIYQEQKKRQMELEQQYDRIENQLHFENENDTESKVLKWKRAVEQADAELTKLYQQERDAKIRVEREETKMSKLKGNYTNVKKDLELVEKELAEHRSEMDVMRKLYLENRKAHIAVQKKIEQKKIECNTVLKECKMENLIIPMSETSHRRLEENCFTSSSSSNAESSDNCKVLIKIDFSQFPENIRNCTKEDLQDMAEQLNEKLTKIQNEFTDVVNPNLKVDKKIDSIVQQMQEINTNLRNCRNKYEKIKTQFESVQAKRYKLFLDSLECVATEIDSIYKSLLNDTSAQAIILPDNPEEPYTGNIIYNCIVPFKGFQPLQYLSGGEKSLASVALLFAIQRYKQMPFLIMDEGDAALDKANIKNVIRFIQSQINTVQLITISLHKELYSNADILVGVTIQHDMKGSRSRVFTILLSKYYT